MPRLTAVVAIVVAVLIVGVARAEHEVYYRYVVLGYVKDARGKPVPSRTVELVRDKTAFSYLAETDADGLFVVVARLGDESVGETLTFRTGRVTARLTARFDPANHVEERGTRLDVEGTRVVERAGRFRSTLARFLASPVP